MKASIFIILCLFIFLPASAMAGQRAPISSSETPTAFYSSASTKSFESDPSNRKLRLLGLFSLVLGGISFWGFRIVAIIGGLAFFLVAGELVGLFLNAYLIFMWVGIFAGLMALVGLILWLIQSRELNQELGMLLAGLALSAFAFYVAIFFLGIF